MRTDFSKKQKEKILKEFDSALYRKFNQGLDDLCNALDEDNHASLYEVLEDTFEDGGAKELRKLVDDLTRVLIQSRKEINNPKIPNNVKPVRFNMPYRPVYKRKRKENPNQMKINFGILGAGRISKIHCHNIYKVTGPLCRKAVNRCA